MISCTRNCTANVFSVNIQCGKEIESRFPDPYLIRHTGLRTRQGEPHPLLFADTEDGLRRIFFEGCVRACEACVRAREATEIFACGHRWRLVLTTLAISQSPCRADICTKFDECRTGLFQYNVCNDNMTWCIACSMKPFLFVSSWICVPPPTNFTIVWLHVETRCLGTLVQFQKWFLTSGAKF